MFKVTIGTGLLLAIVGVGGWLASGRVSPTALLPAALGIPLVVLGWLARQESRRKMAMHVAVIVGGLGFLGSVRGLTQLPALLSGESVARPTAVVAQSIMAVVTGIFVALCVKSFLDARRGRTA